MVAPGVCNSVQDRCIYGKFCTGPTDTCTGTCHFSCFKCTGAASTNCTQCSPLSSLGKTGPTGGSCGNRKLIKFYLIKIF